MGCSGSSPSVDSQGPSRMQMMQGGNMKMGGMGMNMMGGGMNMSKMAPMKLEYFGVHGRGLQIKFVLLYAKYCMWKDCPMTNEEFGKAKMSGYSKYGQVPILTLGDGTQLYQTCAIMRYIAKRFKGMKGE